MLVAPLLAAASIVAGHSAQGREIVAQRSGPAGAPVTVLAVGSIHGDEPGGGAVIRALRARAAPAGVQGWTVRTVNPDGLRRHVRSNARGVDLNRNFPGDWRAAARGRYWPGPRAGSEAETRVVRRLVRRLRPDVTVWYHQPYGLVHLTPGADR